VKYSVCDAGKVVKRNFRGKAAVNIRLLARGE